MSGDDIRAYILLGCLIAVYPVFRGVRAIEEAFGPEVAAHDGCLYEVYKQYDYDKLKSLKPLDKAAESCIANNQDLHDKEVINNLSYKELVKELRRRQRPDQ